MAGLYIHIPFCTSKCGYCNFFSLVSAKQKSAYIGALMREMVVRKAYIGSESIQTIYFGGGSPSLLSPAEINAIIDCVRNNYNILPDAEITFEANPDHLNLDYLKQIKELGINRLSIGIQSFFDDDLQYLGRRHNAQHARQAIADALEVDFPKMTLDLIYGIPTLTAEKWDANLDMFFATGVKHLSAYALTLEEHTLLARKIKEGKLAPIDEEAAINHYKTLVQRTAEKGFIHYEISNFAQPNHYSRHNSLYWTGANYIGFGPSAHSFNGSSRQWNVSDLNQYIENVEGGKQSFEKEILSLSQRYDEYVMTSLRTSWGCDLQHIENAFGLNYRNYCESQAIKFLKNKYLTQESTVLKLSAQGLLFADAIASDLFWDAL